MAEGDLHLTFTLSGFGTEGGTVVISGAGAATAGKASGGSSSASRPGRPATSSPGKAS